LTPEAAQAARRRGRSSRRTEQHMVCRETQFGGIPAGHYFLVADGFLLPPNSNDVLTTHYEVQEIDVRRGQTVRPSFDFQPKNCCIEVSISWDRRPVTEAKVAVYGVPNSTRAARGGPVRIGVARGAHTLIVGSGDRVAQFDVDVVSFSPTRIEIDLADREHLLFSGCPPAAEAFLVGDIPATTRALEREGLSDVAHLIQARMHMAYGDPDAAARHFEQGGHLAEAAELLRDNSQFSQAARLFERAGALERAAETYRAANETGKAGDTYVRAGQFSEAAECFHECGDQEKRVDALEKSGEPFEAAKIAIETDDWARAIRCLQKVTPADPEYRRAAGILAQTYERQGHLDLAIQTIEQVIAVHGDEGLSLDGCSELATLLEKTSQYDRAIETLENIRRRDVAFPGVATRIEGLRKRAASDATQATTSNPATPALEGAFGNGPRYDILGEVGRGGMGVVFRARDRRLGRIVALKRLTENLRDHPKAQELFLREARAAAALNHPNIVTLYDVGQEGDAFFITMECLEGSTLQAILKKRGRLTPRDAARLGTQIAAGLRYAEDQRIVHRDIKTANLFFTKKKVVKIMDFGLAKMIEEVRRGSTVIGGTPYYMAPEQSLGEHVDHRADIYALGVTFFELVTGRVPFTEGDVAYHHRHTAPPDPRDLAPEIPESFARLILQMLAKEPSDRPVSNVEVGEQLVEIARSKD
jgi:tetratricopeptide (TPR) repeat protein